MRPVERMQLIERLKSDYILYLAAMKCERNVEEYKEQYNITLDKLNKEKL